MLKILLIAFCLISIVPANSFAQTEDKCKAAQSKTACPAGCGWSDTTSECSICLSGHYNNTTGGECQKCPDNGLTAASGTEAITQCYKTCGPKSDFDNGTFLPDNDKVYYSTSAYGECKYTNSNNITCNNENNQCTGFHEENLNCISNDRTCSSGKKSGRKFWQYNTREYTSCYITDCGNDDQHLEQLGSICGYEYGQDCAANRGSCTNKLGNCGGNITGYYSWVNQYRYDDCRCETTVTDDYGEYTKSCKPANTETGNKTQWSDDCTQTVSSCVAGYCESSDAQGNCSPTPQGYYSVAATKECTPCPAGATTNGTGKTKATDCAMVRGTETASSNITKFCDKYGCFFIPSTSSTKNAYIYYTGN